MKERFKINRLSVSMRLLNLGTAITEENATSIPQRKYVRPSWIVVRPDGFSGVYASMVRKTWLYPRPMMAFGMN